MSSSVLRIFAVILAIGAIVIGYLGYQASKQSPKPEPEHVEVAEPKGEPVVFAARDIPAGQAIGEEDLTTALVPTRPVRSYATSTALIGRKPRLDIAAGEMVSSSHFPTYSQLALSLQPGERAVAVKVDEVVGAGGFIEPGDHVDVLYYLQGGQEVGKNSSAQVILSNLRVLAFGNVLDASEEQPVADDTQKNVLEKAKIGGSKAISKRGKEEPTGKKSKTAVLAVTESKTSTLMLAESSGKLRLALHGIERGENLPASAGAGADHAGHSFSKQEGDKENKHYIILRELARNGAGKRKTEAVSTGREGGAQIIVHRGNSIETLSLRH